MALSENQKSMAMLSSNESPKRNQALLKSESQTRTPLARKNLSTFKCSLLELLHLQSRKEENFEKKSSLKSDNINAPFYISNLLIYYNYITSTLI